MSTRGGRTGIFPITGDGEEARQLQPVPGRDADRPGRREVLREAASCFAAIELVDGALREGDQVGRSRARFVEHLHDEPGEGRVRGRDVDEGRTRVVSSNELEHPRHGRVQCGRSGISRERDRRERLAGFRQESLLEVGARLRGKDTLLQRAHVPADEADGIRSHVRERRAPALVVNRRKGREGPAHRELADGLPLRAGTRLERERGAREPVPRRRPARLVDYGSPGGVSVGGIGHVRASGAVQLAVQHALPAPAVRPEEQTAVLRRVTSRARHPTGDAGKANLPGACTRFRGVDLQRDQTLAARADPVEPAPIARPDGKPHAVPGEVERLAHLAGVAHGEDLQVRGTEAAAQHMAPVRRDFVRDGGAEALHQLLHGNRRRCRPAEPHSDESRRHAPEKKRGDRGSPFHRDDFPRVAIQKAAALTTTTTNGSMSHASRIGKW